MKFLKIASFSTKKRESFSQWLQGRLWRLIDKHRLLTGSANSEKLPNIFEVADSN